MEKILFIIVLLIWLLVPVLAVAVVLTISKQVKSRKKFVWQSRIHGAFYAIRCFSYALDKCAFYHLPFTFRTH